MIDNRRIRIHLQIPLGNLKVERHQRGYPLIHGQMLRLWLGPTLGLPKGIIGGNPNAPNAIFAQ